MMSLVIILCWIADLSFGASPLFKVPDAFKTRIYGKTSGLEGEEFTIEQYQQSVKTQIIRKTVVRSGQMDDGLIYDETRNHSTLFNFSHCLSNEIGPSSPHRYHLGSIGSIPILDPILLILNESLVPLETRIEEGTVRPLTIFRYAPDPDSGLPYAITVTVNTALNQLDEVIFSKDLNKTSENWIISMRYDEITELVDTSLVTLTPHDVFCYSDSRKKLPQIGKFYYMEVRIMSEYYKKQETLGLVKLAEYVYEGLISVGYHASTDQHIHYTNIVHNIHTGTGAIINRDMALCAQYEIRTNDNSTNSQKRELFKDQVLAEMHFFEKKYFVLFWQVLELIKDESAEWVYLGSRTIDYTRCDIWNIQIPPGWVAEIAFSVAEVRLRESSFSNKLTSVPVAVDIYQTGDTADGKHHVISFRISDYQIDSNPVSTERLFDTSVCYESENSCVVQFKLDMEYEALHQVGLGNVKRAIVQGVAQKTQLDTRQIHDIGITRVPGGHTLVTFTAYHGLETNIISMQIFKERVRAAVDGAMYITFSNENCNKIQIAYSVKDSLVFDYQMVNTPHWSVSIAATISLCIGTTFIGVILGVLFTHCWKQFERRIVKTESGSPNYRRFRDVEIEDVDIGNTAEHVNL